MFDQATFDVILLNYNMDLHMLSLGNWYQKTTGCCNVF